MLNTNSKPLIYVVEDSMASGSLYTSYLQKAGYEVSHIIDGHSALLAIKERMPDVIVQDVCLPDISGLDVLQFVNKQDSPARVVVMTSNSSIDVAVNAMRMGGYDFLEKPFSKDLLLTSVHNALQQISYETEVITTETDNKKAVSKTSDFFIGDSLAMKTVFRTLDSAAGSKASVFITGESGTGKEVCALSLHKSGARRNGPFIALNCAAIPAELFESEFFGHTKGAFSGALSDRKGAVEVADGGTLFLDELRLSH